MAAQLQRDASVALRFVWKEEAAPPYPRELACDQMSGLRVVPRRDRALPGPIRLLCELWGTVAPGGQPAVRAGEAVVVIGATVDQAVRKHSALSVNREIGRNE